MRIIFGLFLALLMVFVALFALIDMTCEQARAPDDREVAIEMRECEITLGDMLFRPLAAGVLEVGALAASNDNHMLHNYRMQKDAATPADAWCLEVTAILMCPSDSIASNADLDAFPGRKRGRTGA
jgi:hypothetical protein